MSNDLSRRDFVRTAGVSTAGLALATLSGAPAAALVVPPIKVRGGTGSALRSFALVPDERD